MHNTHSSMKAAASLLGAALLTLLGGCAGTVDDGPGSPDAVAKLAARLPACATLPALARNGPIAVEEVPGENVIIVYRGGSPLCAGTPADLAGFPSFGMSPTRLPPPGIGDNDPMPADGSHACDNDPMPALGGYTDNDPMPADGTSGIGRSRQATRRASSL